MFKKLGIDAEMKGKAHMIPATPVGEIVARGEADVGFQQIAELLPVSGITFVGPIPEAVQLVTMYSAAVATASKHPDEARKLIAYFTSPEAAPVLTKLGLQPSAR
jgi:molybdate transport system substrate-binding protein